MATATPLDVMATAPSSLELLAQAQRAVRDEVGSLLAAVAALSEEKAALQLALDAAADRQRRAESDRDEARATGQALQARVASATEEAASLRSKLSQREGALSVLRSEAALEREGRQRAEAEREEAVAALQRREAALREAAAREAEAAARADEVCRTYSTCR